MTKQNIKYNMESPQREAYRKECKHYSVEGDCHKQSHAERIYGYYFAVDVACTPDCGCARMRRYDKLHNN